MVGFSLSTISGFCFKCHERYVDLLIIPYFCFYTSTRFTIALAFFFKLIYCHCVSFLKGGCGICIIKLWVSMTQPPHRKKRCSKGLHVQTLLLGTELLWSKKKCCRSSDENTHLFCFWTPPGGEDALRAGCYTGVKRWSCISEHKVSSCWHCQS